MKGDFIDLLIWFLANSNSNNHIVAFEYSLAKAILKNMQIEMCHSPSVYLFADWNIFENSKILCQV